MDNNFKGELEQVSFISGDYQEFVYDIIDADVGTPVDISSIRSCGVYLFVYGDPTVVKTITGIVDNSGTKFKAIFTNDITADLNGLYVQQPYIIDNEGKIFRPAQGLINIIPRANN